MQTNSVTSTRQLPNYPTRFALGMLVLLFTLLLLITSMGPFFSQILVDENCAAVTSSSTDTFSADTAVPDCWLVQ